MIRRPRPAARRTRRPSTRWPSTDQARTSLERLRVATRDRLSASRLIDCPEHDRKCGDGRDAEAVYGAGAGGGDGSARDADRKSTRLNSSHSQISYAVFCLKKKKN